MGSCLLSGVRFSAICLLLLKMTYSDLQRTLYVCLSCPDALLQLIVLIKKEVITPWIFSEVTPSVYSCLS